MRPSFDEAEVWTLDDASSLDTQSSSSVVTALIAGRDLMRIRVFPHKYDYPPHGRDQDYSKLEVHSAKPCTLYEGKKNLAGRYDNILGSVRHLSIRARSLKKPLWLECPESFSIVRAGKNLENYSYSGSLYLARNPGKGRQGELIAVNIIPLEFYLRGVVPVEVLPSWPFEALKAQSVAARSYALYHMENAQKKARASLAFYDMDDSIVYQAFTGISHFHPETDRAVAATTGQVLLHDKKIIQAYYHADSGGLTANPIDAFGIEVPYCEAKKEPKSKKPGRGWQQMMPLSQITMILRGKGFVPRGQFVSSIKVGRDANRSLSRKKTVVAKLSSGKSITLSASRFRQIFRLQSRMFELKTLGQDVLILGSGSGHGVGLSQMGAKKMAHEFSWSYSRILNFYYSNINLCTLHQDLGTELVPFCLDEKSDLASL